MRVAVLHNAPVLPAWHSDAISESDVVDVARALADALASQGLEPVLLPAGPPLSSLLRDLEACAPDVVFNLIEGFGGRTDHATQMTGLLELLGVPFTGCPSDALAVCVSKSRAKALLRGHGLPTAPFAVVRPGASVPDWPHGWPVVVKPDAEDGSLGIDQGSVAPDRARLAARVEQIWERYGGAALIEAYLPGPEYNVGLVGLPDPESLPVAEIAFEPRADAWPIVTYDAKWSPGSPDDRATPVQCPAALAVEQADRLGSLAVAAYLVTGCRDVARVDLRLDAAGMPMILEVNPNPDLGPTAGWARALRVSGRDYAATLAALVRQAWARSRRVAPFSTVGLAVLAAPAMINDAFPGSGTGRIGRDRRSRGEHG